MKSRIRLFLEILESRQRIAVALLMFSYLMLSVFTISVNDYEIVEPDDAYYFLLIARNISEGRGFIELYNYAYRPPLFPAFLSIFFFLGIESLIAVKVLTAAVFSTSIILVWRICRKMFGGLSGVIGGALFTISPWFITMPNYLLSENLFIPLFLLFALGLLRAFRNGRSSSYALAGVFCGLAALTREIMLFVPVILLIVLLICKDKSFTLKKLLLLALLQAMIIAPWTARNYTIFNRFIPISTNSWINLYIGNNPVYENIYSFRWTIPAGTKWNEREQPEGRDEYEVMVRSREEAIRYIKSNPAAFIDRFLKKVWRFLTPHFELIGILGTNMMLKAAVTIDLLLYMLFAFSYLAYLASRIRKIRRSEPFLLFTVVFMLYLTAVAGMTYTNSRYRLPITLIFLVYTTYCADRLLGRLAGIPRGPRRPQSPEAQK